MTGPSDPQFQSLVAERVAAGDPERGDSPAYLLKRLKQLEQGDATLRQNKRSRPEDAAAELKELVTELRHQSCAARFPAQCAAAFDRLSALIEDASDRGSFGLAQSTAEGEALVRSLVLAAVAESRGPEALQPHGAPGRSWLAWAADAARAQDPLAVAISTTSRPAYKASLVDSKQLLEKGADSKAASSRRAGPRSRPQGRAARRGALQTASQCLAACSC